MDDTPMPSESDIVRQEPIAALGPLLAHALAAAAAPASPGPAPQAASGPPGTSPIPADLLAAAVSARCIQCGIEISGAEWIALAGTTPDPSPKLARLRLGFCARNGCNSSYYQVRFAATSGIPWPVLLPEHPLPASSEAPPGPASTGSVWVAALAATLRQGGLRLVVATAALVVLLAARHWYLGGTVPFLREPERFVVETAPEPGQPFAQPHRAPPAPR